MRAKVAVMAFLHTHRDKHTERVLERQGQEVVTFGELAAEYKEP